MKSFFEFYQKLKDKQINEQDQGGMNLNAPAPAAPGGMGMGAGQGGTPAAPAFPSMVGQPGANQAGVLGQDMDLDMGAENQQGQEGDDRISRQTDENIGEQDADTLMQNLQDLLKFVKNYGVGDDQEKSSKKDELQKQLEAVMENLGQLTGTSVPGSDEQEEGEMGGEQEEDGSMPEAPTANMGGGGASPLGGNQFPSEGGGTGDMGGNMAGGSAPAAQGGGMGGMGGGQFGL